MSMMSSLRRQLTKKLNPGGNDTRRVLTDAAREGRKPKDHVPEFIKQRERKSERLRREALMSANEHLRVVGLPEIVID